MSKSRRFIISEENITELLNADDSGDEIFPLDDEDIAFLETENIENVIDDPIDVIIDDAHAPIPNDEENEITEIQHQSITWTWETPKSFEPPILIVDEEFEHGQIIKPVCLLFVFFFSNSYINLF